MKKSIQKTELVFFDASGRRRKVFNILFPFSMVLLFLVLGVVSFYSLQVAKLKNVQSDYLEVTDTQTSVAMLYTDNHSSAFSIVNDRIDSISTIFIPRYLIKDDSIITTEDYAIFLDDIRSIGKNRSGRHRDYAVLSSIDYTIPPTERSESIHVKGQDPLSYTKALTVSEMLKIRSDIEKGTLQGLFIDIDPLSIDSEEEYSSIDRLLEDMGSILGERDLLLGVIITPNNLNPYSSKLLKKVKAVYLRIDLLSGNQKQLDMLVNFTSFMPGEVIIEVPTVSGEIDIAVEEGYYKAQDYKTARSLIDKIRILNRSVEPITITKDNIQNHISDAITLYNFLHYLNNNNFFSGDRHYKFSIADPGYEEFTAWSLIEDPFNKNRSFELLSSNYRSYLDILVEGEGRVYSLRSLGGSGFRRIVFNEDSLVAQSEIINQGDPSIVERKGHVQKKIALTFDDGPHPIYTEKVLDMLDSYGVKGTFFVTGKNVLEYPQVAKEIVNRGHEIENHSFSHPVFSLLDTEAQISEIKSTSEAIKVVTGIEPRFFRTPFSNSSEIDTDKSIVYLEYLANLGLSASEYDIDSKDWVLDSPEETYKKVVDDIENSEGEYSQILFHDSSVRIENTLETLPEVIEYLQNKEISIVRVDELVDSTPFQTYPSTTTLAYRALDWKRQIFTAILLFNVFVIGVAILRNSWFIFGTVVYNIRKSVRSAFLSRIVPQLKRYPEFTVIIPCHNEELVIEKTILSLIDCKYPKLRIIVVNDGSTDNTGKIIDKLSRIYRYIKIINVHKIDKSRALQRALNEVRTEWVVLCDADTVFDKRALHNFANSIFLGNKELGAIAGNILVGNPSNIVTRSQVIEYGIAQQFKKPAQDILNTISVVPGAAGVWNRKKLLQSGGFLHDTLAEDTDATMKMLSLGNRVLYNSQAVARTEVPETYKSLFKQRTRWQLGNLQTIYKHKRGIFNARYGVFGFVELPIIYLDIIVSAMYPLLLIFSLYVLIASFLSGTPFVEVQISYIDSRLFTILGIIFVLMEVLLGLLVIIFQKNHLAQKIRLVLTLPYFLFIYKIFLSYATIISVIRALRGTAHSWDFLSRTANVIR